MSFDIVQWQAEVEDGRWYHPITARAPNTGHTETALANKLKLH